MNSHSTALWEGDHCQMASAVIFDGLTGGGLCVLNLSYYHYGKLDVCRVLNLLPSVFFRTLGK